MINIFFETSVLEIVIKMFGKYQVWEITKFVFTKVTNCTTNKNHVEVYSEPIQTSKMKLIANNRNNRKKV